MLSKNVLSKNNWWPEAKTFIDANEGHCRMIRNPV